MPQNIFAPLNSNNVLKLIKKTTGETKKNAQTKIEISIVLISYKFLSLHSNQ